MAKKVKKSATDDLNFEKIKANYKGRFDDICGAVLIAIPPRGIIASVNLETEELTGYEASELQGMKFSEIFCDDDKQRIDSLFEVSNVESLEFRRLFEHNVIIQKRSKRKIIVDMGIKLGQCDEKPVFVFTLQDITDLKNSEQETIKANNYVNSILTSMQESLFVIDQQQNIKTVNQSALSLLEYQEDEIVGSSVSAIFKDPKVIEKLRIGREFESEFISKSKKNVSVLVSTAPLQSAAQADEFQVLLAIDITELKKSERLIAEQQMMLVQSSKMSALGVMASGIAHEINNPLHIIKGNCELLDVLLANEPVEYDTTRKAIQVIDRMSARIDDTIKGLSSFSRDERNDPLEPTSLSSIVKETLQLCGTRIANSGIRFIQAEIPDDLMVECRPTQISQVILNLLNNAYDEVLDSKEPVIELQISSDEKGVTIAVSNSGEKISNDLVEKIFNPFFTTKGVGKGTGLGLSISKSIVEDHGGSLGVDQNSECTKFVISLPKTAAKGLESEAS